MKMKVQAVRVALLCVFALALAAEIVAVVVVRNRMWPEEFQSLIKRLLSVYSASLGVVITGMFITRNSPSLRASKDIGLIALALAIAWNVLIGWRPVSLIFAKEDNIKDVLDYLDAVNAGGAFLVTAALTHFFGKKAASKT